MDGFEVTGPYLSAMLMSFGALCVFIWGVLSGASSEVDDASLRFYHTEMDSERNRDQATQSGE